MEPTSKWPQSESEAPHAFMRFGHVTLNDFSDGLQMMGLGGGRGRIRGTAEACVLRAVILFWSEITKRETWAYGWTLGTCSILS